VAIAAASIGGDEQLERVGVSRRTDKLPPRLDRPDRKHSCVATDAHADEPVVGGEAVDTIGIALPIA
jgi:hypothetical protein